ncbi:MAG: hypothetical protein B7X11_00410 [Acidobacteria bacterium 37-65-4]|nr:MAG: hypothetical protein B7X11_00410 [Acidobacteria bacterium 37-65-4]
MRRPVSRLLYWTPRVLCILFAASISIFAADVFSEAGGFWQTALGLLMHLIPALVIVAVLVVSGRREWIDGALFIALGALYIVWAWNRPFARWYVFLLIAGPPILTGSLFLLDWRHRVELRAHS